MKVLVTGAAGMLGRETFELLDRDPGLEVRGPQRSELDLTDAAAVDAWHGAHRPDIVVNCAGYTAVDDCETHIDAAYAGNELAVRNLAHACERYGSHLVHVSTDYVFDGTKPEPYTEWDMPNPQSVYGASKLAGERSALSVLGEDCTIVRTSWVCGRYGNNMVKTVCRLATQTDSTMRFVSDQRGCPTFADDLAAMLAKLGRERRPGVFHVTNQGAVSWYEFVAEIVRQLGVDTTRVEPITTSELQPPRPAPRPANSVLDNLALRLSGIELLPDFREPLARCLRALDDQ